MYPLHAELASFSQAARLEKADYLIAGIRAGDDGTRRDFCQLVLDVVQHTPDDDPHAALAPGEYCAGFAAYLLDEGNRISSFINAIAREEDVTSALDIGTGPGAIFAAAAALLHRRATVTAVEANRRSAACAEKIVGLLGLEGRVIVTEGNAFDIELPKVDLGVTDTFAEALLPGRFDEQGPHISALLAQHAARILPAKARIFARDFSADTTVRDMNRWQAAGIVDLRQPPEAFTGLFTSSGSGDRFVEIYSGLYDDKLRPILEGYRTDNLTVGVFLGNLAVSRASALIGFRYLPGTSLEQYPAQLWQAA